MFYGEENNVLRVVKDVKAGETTYPSPFLADKQYVRMR